jgi:hypothetical protein
MRKQYHFQKSERGLLAWDIEALIMASKNFPRLEILVSDIKELNEPYWFGLEGNNPTCRAILEHMQLINAVDLSYPIILSSSGRVMDGMHRVCKAFAEEMKTIQAVQFKEDPEPHFIGVNPDKLPY